MSDDVLVSRETGVMTITLNRPDKLNAITFAMNDTLYSFIDEAAADDAIRVLVITGAGRAFCAGDDLKESDPRGEAAPKEYTSIAWHDFVRKLRALPKPTVAAINGMCCGAGIGLVLGCDVRIASDRAQFADIFMRRGIVGGAAALTRLLGASQALELIYTGDFIDAHEAHRIGLFNRLVPHDSLQDVVDSFTGRLTEMSPWALARSKRCVYEIETLCLEEALLIEQEAKLESLKRDDYRNAVIAFNDGTAD